ncbi:MULTISPECIES: hypothetical protein [unclassified Streptomyces]|uniref:hypothetical protein n=1 Tax=unclassified Streptomyces TaxID=2593676 RepID=UPI0013DDF22F|nr:MULTISPECIES: hypothetical protein [unclassified Streptomyces]
MRAWARGPRPAKHRQNALIVAVDPAAFGDAGEFAEAVDGVRGQRATRHENLG